MFKDILDSTEVETALDKLWVEIESRSEAVSRSDPSTWDNGWQTNGWGHDDFLWYVRGIPNVRKVWEQLHDTEDVIVSFDGANIQRPWGLNPEWRGGAGTLQANATATEAFECFAAQLPILDSLGLKVAYAGGGYSHAGLRSVDQIAGGAGAMGGVTDQVNFSHPVYPTTPEVAWVVRQLQQRNLSHIVVQYFLHDDVVSNNQAINDAVDWLKANAPSIVAQTNCGNQGYDTLYQDRQATFVPEEYAIDGSVSETTRQVAVDAELALFESNQYIAQRYRLLPWPLFALGDGGGVHNLASASLVRVQVYGALAYGMKGLYYYCWGNGIWNVSGPGANTGGAPGSATPNYNVVKAINVDAAKFGKRLLKLQHLGAIRAPAPPISRARAPSPSLPITAMDDSMLAGVFASGDGSSYLMLVDTRTAVRNKTLGTSGKLPSRSAKLTLHSACTSGAAFVDGGDGGYEQSTQLEVGAHMIRGAEVSVSLAAGGGALLRLSGAGCAAVVANTRQWRFHPRTLSLKGGSEIQLSGKSADYSRFGAARRHFAPGGPAGWESNFLLGGSYFEGASGGFKSEYEAVAFAHAGFAIASVAEAGLKKALGYAAAYGNFVFGTTQTTANTSQVMSAADAASLGSKYSCHTNLLGAVLANAGAAALASGAAATKSLKHFDWMFPMVVNVESVAQAQALAKAGITPLPAVLLPSAAGVASASAWGQATLDLLSGLNAATADRSMLATMAVTIDACAYDSESLNRAAAYWSVIFGSQMLWWEGVGKCAAVGWDKFAMIAETNRRLTQWAEPLFQKGSSSPAWNAVPRETDGAPGTTPSSDCRHGGDCFSEALRYNVTHVYSTSSLKIPTLQGVSPTRPGAAASDLIQSMDDELLVIVLTNATVEVADSDAGIEFEFTKQRYLLVLSTALSLEKGGAPVREVAVKLRDDVTSTQPIEPDAFQGFATVQGATTNSYSPTPEQGIPPTFRGDHKCPLSWLGSQMGSPVGSGRLRLAGGSAQLLSYSLEADFSWPRPAAAAGDEAAAHRQMVGRAPPRKV